MLLSNQRGYRTNKTFNPALVLTITQNEVRATPLPPPPLSLPLPAATPYIPVFKSKNPIERAKQQQKEMIQRRIEEAARRLTTHPNPYPDP